MMLVMRSIRHILRDGIAAPSDALVALSTIPVEIVPWPNELEREAELARAGRLRLLLVPAHATPPSQWDPFMDWIHLPTTDEDIWSRVTALQLRVQTSPPPRLDDYGVLWRDQSWVSVAPADRAARPRDPHRAPAGLLRRRRTVPSVSPCGGGSVSIRWEAEALKQSRGLLG